MRIDTAILIAVMLTALACQPRPKEPAAIEGDLIYVTAGSSEAIGAAIEEFSNLYSPPEQTTHRVYIGEAGEGAKVVTFEPALPPAEFVNLILWLDAPPGTAVASGARGRFHSPSDGTAYVLWPDRSAGLGDTLLGVSERGRQVSVYAPLAELSLEEHDELPLVDLTAIQGPVKPALEFEITVGSASTSSNPGFLIGW